MRAVPVTDGFEEVGINTPRKHPNILEDLANPRPLHDNSQTIFRTSTQLSTELASMLRREWWFLRHPEMGWIAVFVKAKKE